MMTTESAYRNSSIAGASPIGLMVVLFDTLAADLGRAAIAINQNDIESRCKELNHATLVIGRLESWVDLKNGGDSAQNLSHFYAYVRVSMMEAAAAKSATVLAALIGMILNVRSAWQQLDASTTPLLEVQAGIQGEQTNTAYPTVPAETPDRIPLSLSA
jgi:flagellar protein FliS